MSSDPTTSGDSKPASADGKSSIEAELEELRRQQLSKSNAQRLDSAPVAPINLQDWQLQQKALKDKDRMSKTNAEAMLHNYRGLDEEKSKLSSIKQEDRKGKEDAARLLHGYRAGVGDMKTPPKNPRKTADGLPPGADAIGNDGMEGVSVSDMASNYDQSGQAGAEIAQGAATSGALANPPSLIAEEPKDPNSPGGSSDSGIMVQSPEQQMSSLSANAVNTSTEGWVAVETTDAPEEEVSQAAELVVQQSSTEVPIQGTGSNTSVPVESTGTTVETVSPHFVESTPTEPKHVRLDVEFTFVLLFSDFIPNVDKYMAATAEIVSGVPSVVFNPAFAPFVRDVQEDSSFRAPPRLAGAKKCVVRATAPVFVVSGYDMEVPRSEVWTALRSAIEGGSFLEIAKRQ